MRSATSPRTVIGVTVDERVPHVLLVDGLIAAAVALTLVAVMPQIADEGRAIDGPAYAAIAVAGGALALRRLAPVVGLVIVTAALCFYGARSYPGGPVYLTLFVATFGVAMVLERWRALALALAAMAAVTVAVVIGGEVESGFHILLFSWAAATVFLAEAVRNRRAYVAGLEDRTRQLEATREEEARRQVAEERVRIARELHDVVAHNIASIAVQAGTAAHLADRQPERARAALLAIKDVSKTTLDELRATVGVLREDREAPRLPTPGLDQLEGLVVTAGLADVAVEIDRRGVVRPLPQAVDIAAYRIVQESLTNVIRHAEAETARVTVTYALDTVEVEVTDDGRGAATAATNGHGVVGMQERARSIGGTLTAGPSPTGGFRVHAVLPARRE
jgi:signal transduction histidine kinase